MSQRPLSKQLLAQKRFRQVIIALVILSVVLGVAIIPLERTTGNIRNLSDGLWWAATTVSSVGYGDYYPVTHLGRVIGVFLQGAGVLMFGLVVGLISHALYSRQDDVYRAREAERFADLTKRLERMEKKLNFVVRNGHEGVEDDESTRS